MSNQASVPLRVMNFWRDVKAFNIPTAPSARHAAVELGIPGIQRLPHDLCWAQPETREQPINLVSAHEGTVLYLYTPTSLKTRRLQRPASRPGTSPCSKA